MPRNLKNITLIILSLLLSKAGFNQVCLDFNELNTPISAYNLEINYPSGSTLHQFGDIKMINSKGSSNPNNPTIIDSLSNGALYFQGKITFDFSLLDYECKKLTFLAITDTIFIDNYKLDLNLSPPIPYKIGDSIIIVQNGIYLDIIGKYNQVSFDGFQSTKLSDVCLQECDGIENCVPDFSLVSDYDGNLSIQNQSSFDYTNTNSFTWVLDNSIYLFDENPAYTFTEEGKYEVCLAVTYSACLLGGPNMYECDSVDIKFGGIFQEEVLKHVSITPNNDGHEDFVRLEAGCKIYDRGGVLITELREETEWYGLNNNLTPLPTGLYIVSTSNGSILNITVIR